MIGGGFVLALLQYNPIAPRLPLVNFRNEINIKNILELLLVCPVVVKAEGAVKLIQFFLIKIPKLPVK